VRRYLLPVNQKGGQKALMRVVKVSAALIG